MRFKFAPAGALMLCGASLAFGDFQYQQTTKITGGTMLTMLKMVGRFSGQARQGLEPVTQKVALKGNRMAHIDKDTIQIIDLDSQTFTTIDHAKKQYSVMTFEQMKQAMEQAAKEMEQKMNQKDPEADRADVSFHASVRDGNQSRDISGLSAKLSILTMAMDVKDKQTGQQGAMSITADMWLAPDIPGYAEVRDFQRRLAEKLGLMTGGGLGPMAGMQRSMMKGYAELAKEGSKLKGVPVFEVVRMGATADGQPLPSAAEAPLPPAKDIQLPSAGEIASDAAAHTATSAADSAISSKLGKYGGLAGGIGGLGGFGKKKKQQQEEKPAEQPAQAPTAQQQALASVLIESETELGGFSSAAVDPSLVSVPAGYRQVESDMLKRTRK